MILDHFFWFFVAVFVHWTRTCGTTARGTVTTGWSLYRLIDQRIAWYSIVITYRYLKHWQESKNTLQWFINDRHNSDYPQNLRSTTLTSFPLDSLYIHEQSFQLFVVESYEIFHTTTPWQLTRPPSYNRVNIVSVVPLKVSLFWIIFSNLNEVYPISEKPLLIMQQTDRLCFYKMSIHFARNSLMRSKN